MTDTPTPQPGDRVRVTYEGVYRDGPDGGHALDLADEDGVYGLMAIDLAVATSVEILPPADLPVGTVMIGWESEAARDEHVGACSSLWVFEQVDSDGWRSTGVDTAYDLRDVWARTSVGRRIITPETPLT
jgi:hypothetical protein